MERNVFKTLDKGRMPSEKAWGSVRLYIDIGLTTREEVCKHLKEYLEISIPYIEEHADISMLYWKREIREMRTALAALNNGGAVTYKGVEL